MTVGPVKSGNGLQEFIDSSILMCDLKITAAGTLRCRKYGTACSTDSPVDWDQIGGSLRVCHSILAVGPSLH